MSDLDRVYEEDGNGNWGWVTKIPDGGSQTALFETPGVVSPLGFLTPTGVGYLYQDIASGALWQAIGVTNGDWIIVGGAGPSNGVGITEDVGSGVAIQYGTSGLASILQTPHGQALKVTDNGVNAQVGFFGSLPIEPPEILGQLSAVTDANAKNVLTSLIAALVNYGLVTDGTT
jgi:hypothetical protein